MRYAISGAAMLIFLASNAFAAESTKGTVCPRPDNVASVLLKYYPDIKFTHITGADARRFMDSFASPRIPGNASADEVLIARNPSDLQKARVGLFKDGCLLGIISSDLWAVDKLQRSLASDQEI